MLRCSERAIGKPLVQSEVSISAFHRSNVATALCAGTSTFWALIESAILVAALVGCGSPTSEQQSRYRVGVLLPYTGDDAASGVSLERGVLMAHRTYENAGGRQVSLVFRDASDDPARAANEARELADEGVVAIIGPGPDNLAGPVVDVLSERGVPLISPVATTAGANTFDDDNPWIRVSVPGTILARTLAKLLSEQEVTSVHIIAAEDAFHREFSDAFADRAGTLGIDVVTLETVDERQQSFSSVVKGLVSKSDGILLAMNPLPAARLINEVAVSDARPREWFLGPRLKSDVFLLNVVPGTLEGALGVSPETLLNQEAFSERFALAWDGDTPLEGAHFSYDAAALAFTAIDRLRRSSEDDDLSPRDLSAALEQTVLELAEFGGTIVHWDDLQEAIERNDAGRKWQLSGVTGPMVLAPDGARRSGSTAAWSVEGDQIVHFE
jgi:ABC-type branched-subunit amino acid transport system substrate-binding protein